MDAASLAALSCAPGGWDAAGGVDRARAWAFFLGVDVGEAGWERATPTAGGQEKGAKGGDVSETGHLDEARPDTAYLVHPPRPGAAPPAHPDERQVALDVERSFTAYKLPRASLPQRRAQLTALIVGTLRRFPELHYYQGFHDVVSVVLLTMCASASDDASTAAFLRAQRVVDRLALHFVRDAMTQDLAPIMAQLKIVRNIVRAANAPYGYALEDVFAPSLALVALPWILTLFSHDAPSLPAAQQIFDYILSHGPGQVLYVSAALILRQRRYLVDLADEKWVPMEELDMPLVHRILADAMKLEEGDGGRADDRRTDDREAGHATQRAQKGNRQ
ncbi:GTPase-activating protein gyp8 [Malassezia sp. CBS 17886]|nr:GTPase-activating protein gyp8 [Malassezia sp. CBS 17886]